MINKIAVFTILTVGVICSPALGQSPSLFGTEKSFNVGQVRFLGQDDDAEVGPIEALQEQIKRMELRHRELEIDIENKLEDKPKVAKADKKGYEELSKRLDELEEVLEKQDEEVGRLEDTLPGLVYHSHKSPKLEFFGRIHLDYWAFPKVDETLYPLEGENPQDRFVFRRLRIGIKGDFFDNMFYKYEGEFAGGAGATSHRDAFIGFDEIPYLQTVTFGNHKRPYGLDNLNSSNYNVFMERPFVIEAFNQENRRLGISSTGFSEDESWNWRYGVWNQELTQSTSGYIGDHYQLEVAGRLARTAWYDESSGGRGYAHFAIAGSYGVPDGRDGITNNQARYQTRPEARTEGRWHDTGAITGANQNYLIGLESAINIGAFNVTSEYQRVNVDRRDAVGEDVAFDGYYGQVSYFLTGEHRMWNRQTGTLGRVQPVENFFIVRDCDCEMKRGRGAWEIATRYSHLDLNDFDVIGGVGNSFTLGLNWYWNAYARMQFNYIIGKMEPGANNDGFGDYEIFGIRMMVDF